MAASGDEAQGSFHKQSRGSSEVSGLESLATTRQGAFKSIVVFKQRYTNALKAYKDQKNPAMMPQDEVMDFFSKLDNARYAEFKMNYINGLQLKLCKPPVYLNEIFTLANTFLKPKIPTYSWRGRHQSYGIFHV
jgi:hypothetical protein